MRRWHPLEVVMPDEKDEGIKISAFGGACLEVCLGDSMRKISIRLTEKHYEMLEQLVIEGEYASVSEAIRDAIRRLLQEKAEIIERSRNLSSYR